MGPRALITAFQIVEILDGCLVGLLIQSRVCRGVIYLDVETLAQRLSLVSSCQQ